MIDHSFFPNSTQVPDVLTDRIMPLVSGNEWKVIHYGVRYSLGHRSKDTLTIAQIARGRQDDDGSWADHGTGLNEDQVKECLAFLCDEVHLFLREDQPRKPLAYRLNLDLSSIDWTALERRSGATPAVAIVEAVAAEAAAPSPAPAIHRTRRAPANLVELPLTDVRLDGPDGAMIDRFQEMLSGDEWKTFDYLLNLARQKSRLEPEEVVWPLYKLWQTYGFRRLQNAFQSPMPITSLDDLNHSCLVGIVAEMLEAERFGQMTPAFREQIVTLTREWPKLSDWQEAITSAVNFNSRRLSTVEKNLKRAAGAPGMQSDGDKPNARTTAPQQGRRRSARRASEYSETELKAIRESEDDSEWVPPPH